MPNDWLQHKQLQIIRGVYAAPGDAFSVEPAIVTLNLMSNDTGIALKSDGWSPNIPSLKDSGVWADSPISDGRKLISGVNSNVVETMQLTITGATFQDVTAWLSALRNMMQDARDFWQANAQIDPVYLKWWASCGAGAQYALIYNMDMKPEYVVSPKPTLNVTLAIERECFWRSIPPGANPKQWTYEAAKNAYSTTKSSLSGTDSLVYQSTIQNKSEFDATFQNLNSNNAVVIPAASIPGDAPALVSFYHDSNAANMIIGKKTVKITTRQQNTPTQFMPQNLIFNMGDGTNGTDATLANDTGAVKAAGAANAQRLEVSFATATNQLRWRNLQTTYFPNSINRFIGRFMVFMRCRQSAGAAGDVTMYLRFGRQIAGDTDGIKLNVTSPPVIAGAGNSTNWGLVYMGVIACPLDESKASIYKTAGDLSISQSSGLRDKAEAEMSFGLFALRSAGVGLLYISDLILIPVDEGGITIEQQSIPGTGAYYDATGYTTRGASEVYTESGNNQLTALTGQGIQLTPNVENRLYLLMYNGSTLPTSQVAYTANVAINIIPRWQGIRGV